MFFGLATLVSGIIIYFLPNIMYSSNWKEIVEILNGVYDNDIISQLKIIEKYNIQNNYKDFFHIKFSMLIWLSIAIYIVLLIVFSLLKKIMKKNIIETNKNKNESKK